MFKPGNFFGLMIFLGLFAPAIQAQPKVGLFHTPAEVVIWQDRMKDGPYKTDGDAGKMSPGDWDRILEQADEFLEDPSSDRVTWPTDQAIAKGSYEPRPDHLGLRDAAFVYLVTRNTNYADAVKGELLAQSAEPSCDFYNSTVWSTDANLNTTANLDGNPFFVIAAWMARLLYAYDLVEDRFSAGEKNQMETWFLNGAQMFHNHQNDRTAKLWPNRNSQSYESGDYTPSATAATAATYTHDGGYHNYKGNTWYANRAADAVLFFGLVGVKFDDATLINSAKTWCKEYVAFGVHPSGLAAEFYRTYNQPSRPEAGYGYSAETLDAMLIIADALARTGDTGLYDFTTSDGYQESTDGSTQKSLLLVAQALSNLLYDNYYDIKTDSYAIYSGTTHNSSTKMDGRHVDLSAIYPRPIWYTRANIYYQDSDIEYAYKQIIDEDTNHATMGGIYPYGGIWGVFPGTLFMWGGLEGTINYPKGGEANLNVQTRRLPQTGYKHEYKAQLYAIGGTPPYTWSLPEGSQLPDGLSLKSDSGVVYGIPGTAGDQSFSITVYDSQSQSTTQQVNVEILSDDPEDYSARYTFDSIDTWGRDETGHHDAISQGNPSSIIGQIKDGLDFADSEDQYLEIDGFDYWTDGFALSMWLKIDDNSRWRNQYLFSHGLSGALPSVESFLISSVDRAGEGNLLRTKIYGETGGSTADALDFNVVTSIGDGQWHQYTLVMNTSQIQIYWDGRLRASSKVGIGAINPDGKIYVGRSSDGDSLNRFHSGLDDLRVYDRALGEQEVAALYRGGISRAPWNGSRGWKEVSWFGWVYDYNYPWTYHLDHQWQYLIHNGEDAFWIVDFELGWLWTTSALYPYLYSRSEDEWLYFYRDLSEPRYFYGLTQKRWFAVP